MTEKTEWELVDEASLGAGADAGTTARQAAPLSLRDMMKALLGRYWGWKLLGAAIAASVVITLLVMLTGVAVVLITAGALLSLGIGKLRQWLGRDERSVMR